MEGKNETGEDVNKILTKMDEGKKMDRNKKRELGCARGAHSKGCE